jgi:PAS domain S-box-containing protein
MMSIADLSADDSAYSQAEATKIIRKAVTDGPQVFEWLSRRKNGALFWVEVSLNAIGNTDPQQIQAIARDITDRKRATAAALASELRFRSMFENSMSGIAIFSEVEDGEDFIILDFNPASEAIEKVNRDEVIGKRLLEMFPAAIEMGIFEVFQRVWRTGISEKFPVTFYKDGVIDGWRENQIYRLPSGEVVVVYNDLTAEKKVEAALRESEEKYRLLATNMLDMIWTVDLEFNITYVNDAVFDLTGYTPEEVIGQNTLTFMSPVITERIKNDVQQLIDDHYAKKVSNHKIEAQYICRDGSVVDVEIRAKLLFDDNQNLVGFQVRSCDISERKLVEVEKERLLAAIDQVGEMIVITDTEGLFQFVNPSF